MQRYTLVTYDDATDEVKALYDDYLRTTSSVSVPIWVQSLGHNKDLLRAYWERTKGSLAAGTLPALLKEMVIFIVSIENGSRYCSACHAHAVLSLDATLNYDNINALAALDTDQIQLPAAFIAALTFAKKVSDDPNGIQNCDFDDLEDAGFSPDEINELQSVIDLAIMFNNYTSVMRLPLDPEYRPIIGTQ